MDFEQYANNLKSISGVKGAIIVDEENDSEIIIIQDKEVNIVKSRVNNLLQQMNEKTLGLSIKSVKFESDKGTILCLVENNTILFLIYDKKKTDLNSLKNQIDKFLNDLLIHF